VNVARRNSSMLESKAQTADCSKIFSWNMVHWTRGL
jgi:hypothetical protein